MSQKWEVFGNKKNFNNKYQNRYKKHKNHHDDDEPHFVNANQREAEEKKQIGHSSPLSPISPLSPLSPLLITNEKNKDLEKELLWMEENKDLLQTFYLTNKTDRISRPKNVEKCYLCNRWHFGLDEEAKKMAISLIDPNKWDESITDNIEFLDVNNNPLDDCILVFARFAFDCFVTSQFVVYYRF